MNIQWVDSCKQSLWVLEKHYIGEDGLRPVQIRRNNFGLLLVPGVDLEAALEEGTAGAESALEEEDNSPWTGREIPDLVVESRISQRPSLLEDFWPLGLPVLFFLNTFTTSSLSSSPAVSITILSGMTVSGPNPKEGGEDGGEESKKEVGDSKGVGEALSAIKNIWNLFHYTKYSTIYKFYRWVIWFKLKWSNWIIVTIPNAYMNKPLMGVFGKWWGNLVHSWKQYFKIIFLWEMVVETKNCMEKVKKWANFLCIFDRNLKRVATGPGWWENSEIFFGDSWGIHAAMGNSP